MAADSPRAGASDESCSLDRRSQARNIALYVASNWLLYLAAPVLYVGITQAALCDRLGALGVLANLPNSAFFWMTAIPILFAWRFPSTRAVKPVLAACYTAAAAGGLLVATSLMLPLSSGLKLTSIVVYGALIGGSQATLSVFLWDLLNHGVAASRRGIAFSLAFGIGPLFAVLGSLAAQLALSGEVQLPYFSRSSWVAIQTFTLPALEFPLNFVLVFGACIPLMLSGALLSAFYVLPVGARDIASGAFIASVRNGFREIAADRTLLTTVIAFLAISAGDTIVNNMSLFTTEAIGRLPEDFAGSQNAIRFAFKSAMGLFLGWLLVKTHAKMGALVTSGFGLLGILWILVMPKQWFLVSFGLMGAADLYGIYYSNYLVSRSRPEKVRLNMALLSVLTILSSFAPALFGIISDQFGFRASFIVAGCFIAGSFALVLFFLPARATPRQDQRKFEAPIPVSNDLIPLVSAND